MLEAAEIRPQLQRILSHALFCNSARLSGFLRYIVEETLAGRAAEIKEYTIGVCIYDRGASFDPKTDSIVRVEAARLRRKLEQYYSGPGAADLVRIELAKGSYSPLCTGQLPPALTTAGIFWRIGIAVFCAAILTGVVWRITRQPEATFRIEVLPFANLTGDPAQDAYTAALADQMAARLSDEPGVRSRGARALVWALD